MKKFDYKKLDPSYLKIAFYVFAVAAAVILFEKLIGNLPTLGASISTGFGVVAKLGTPFLIGFAIAYLINPFMKFFEKHLVNILPLKNKKTHSKGIRAFSILVNYFIVIGGLIWVTLYLVPALKDSVISLISISPEFPKQLDTFANDLFSQFEFINPEDVTATLNRLIQPIMGLFQNMPQLITDIATNLYSVGRLTVDVIMALFISFYMLFDKENFGRQGKKLLYSLRSPEKAEQSHRNIVRINGIFQDFIVGKMVDSMIIGVLAFFGFSLMNAPFALVLSLIIGVTNIIPYFGPFIGAIPATLITLLIDPITAVWVVAFIIVLQQFDGNYLGPKILGDSLDLSPLWIILGVVVGGAIMGPLGMFVGVPILATIKTFGGEYLNRLYKEKYPNNELRLLSKKELEQIEVTESDA